MYMKNLSSGRYVTVVVAGISNTGSVRVDMSPVLPGESGLQTSRVISVCPEPEVIGHTPTNGSASKKASSTTTPIALGMSKFIRWEAAAST
jgi:hypothetical protein